MRWPTARPAQRWWPWFAWRPVKIVGKTRCGDTCYDTVVWMEWVEYSWHATSGKYLYRSPSATKIND